VTVRLLTGDCREVLKTLPDASVQMVCTSPPYFGLRSYLPNGHEDKHKELGSESSVDAYVAEMVAVFREVRRVLRPDGVAFINLGDSYAGSWGNQGRKDERGTQRAINGPMLQNLDADYPSKQSNTGTIRDAGLKPKDLIGIPWRVAFALQADGWYLRSDIIWSKPNPMPESVRDRPTKAHEYIFLLSKSPRYFFDAEAVKEPADSAMEQWRRKNGRLESQGPKSDALRDAEIEGATRKGFADSTGRNIRSVWTIAQDAGDMTEWIGKIGFCQRCNGVRVAGNGPAPMTSRDTDASTGSALHPTSFERTEFPTNFLLGQSALDLPSIISAVTEGASTPPTLNQSPSRRTSCEATPPQPETLPSGNAHRDTNTLLTTLMSALMASENAGNVCECDDESNSLGSVWNIATSPFSAAHFATFPPALAEKCIRAGTSEKGACAACGAPWVRTTEPSPEYAEKLARANDRGDWYARVGTNEKREDGTKHGKLEGGIRPDYRTTGWQPTCTHTDAPVVPCVVLDCFSGAGTTGLVADRLGRDAILVELSPQYSEMARKRITGDAPMFAAVQVS
jgi:DNA modification methylase